MSIFANIQRRKARPVEVSGGTLFIRDLTFAERERVAALPEGVGRDGLAVALSLVKEDGSQSLPKSDGESDADLSARMVEEFKELSADDVDAISNAIAKANRIPTAETMAKKSEGTPS